MSLETAYKNCLLFLGAQEDKYYLVNPQTHQFQNYEITAIKTRYPRQEDVINALNDMIKIIQTGKESNADSLSQFYSEFITRVIKKFRPAMVKGLNALQKSMYPEEAKSLSEILNKYLSDDGLLANARRFAPPPPAPPLPEQKQKVGKISAVRKEVTSTDLAEKPFHPFVLELQMKLKIRAQVDIDAKLKESKAEKPENLTDFLHQAILLRRTAFNESIINQNSEIFE